MEDVWRNIRGTWATMDEAKSLVSQVKTIISEADMIKFDWELTERDQENGLLMVQ